MCVGGGYLRALPGKKKHIFQRPNDRYRLVLRWEPSLVPCMAPLNDGHVRCDSATDSISLPPFMREKNIVFGLCERIYIYIKKECYALCKNNEEPLRVINAFLSMPIDVSIPPKILLAQKVQHCHSPVDLQPRQQRRRRGLRRHPIVRRRISTAGDIYLRSPGAGVWQSDGPRRKQGDDGGIVVRHDSCAAFRERDEVRYGRLHASGSDQDDASSSSGFVSRRCLANDLRAVAAFAIAFAIAAPTAAPAVTAPAAGHGESIPLPRLEHDAAGRP